MIHLIKTASATTTIHINPAHPNQAIHDIYQQFSTHTNIKTKTPLINLSAHLSISLGKKPPLYHQSIHVNSNDMSLHM